MSSNTFEVPSSMHHTVLEMRKSENGDRRMSSDGLPLHPTTLKATHHLLLRPSGTGAPVFLPLRGAHSYLLFGLAPRLVHRVFVFLGRLSSIFLLLVVLGRLCKKSGDNRRPLARPRPHRRARSGPSGARGGGPPAPAAAAVPGPSRGACAACTRRRRRPGRSAALTMAGVGEHRDAAASPRCRPERKRRSPPEAEAVPAGKRFRGKGQEAGPAEGARGPAPRWSRKRKRAEQLGSDSGAGPRRPRRAALPVRERPRAALRGH